MTRVIAALDNSLAARSVMTTALAFARLLDAEVDAVHVACDGDRVSRAAAAAAGLQIQLIEGPVVEALLELGVADDVAAVVLGARRTPSGSRPLGSAALAVATTLPKAVVIVPPDAAPPKHLRRLLVPLEGTVATSLAPRPIVELAQQANLEVIVLHVYDEASLPAFTDQPQHEERARAKEFLARHCPWGKGVAQLDIRVGRCEELVPIVAEEEMVDLIALGWSQALAHGRARVVQAALARTKVPIILIPVSARS